jgi:hypothetical protein
MSNVIIVPVLVNRYRTPQAALDATGRRQHIMSQVVSTMPRRRGDEKEVHLFELGYSPTPRQLYAEFRARRLAPDPMALIALNEADPAFADSQPNVTQWRNKEGEACCLVFNCFAAERRVYVYKCLGKWPTGYRFAGVPMRSG